jgi:NADPH:quinone reductase
MLNALGATRVLLENGKLSEAVRETYPDGIDGILDIIGNSTLLDSLRMVRKGGSVCVAGFLGHSEPIAFDWLANMPFGVDLNAFASLLFGTKDFPHSTVPMQQIVDRVANGTYRTKPVKVFPFERIPDAHRLMESNSANGKIVVVQ